MLVSLDLKIKLLLVWMFFVVLVFLLLFLYIGFLVLCFVFLLKIFVGSLLSEFIEEKVRKYFEEIILYG